MAHGGQISPTFSTTLSNAYVAHDEPLSNYFCWREVVVGRVERRRKRHFHLGSSSFEKLNLRVLLGFQLFNFKELIFEKALEGPNFRTLVRDVLKGPPNAPLATAGTLAGNPSMLRPAVDDTNTDLTHLVVRCHRPRVAGLLPRLFLH